MNLVISLSGYPVIEVAIQELNFMTEIAR